MALQTRHVLQNNLTKYFSEVPFHTWSSCEGENSVFVPSISDEDDKSWECKKAPPGKFQYRNVLWDGAQTGPSYATGCRICFINVHHMK